MLCNYWLSGGSYVNTRGLWKQVGVDEKMYVRKKHVCIGDMYG